MTTINLKAYDVNTLRNAAEAYCYEQQDYMSFCKDYKSARESGSAEYWGHKQAMDRAYDRKYDSASAAYDKLLGLCALVGADLLTVLRVEKSIRRNSQYHHAWERSAHLGCSWYWQGEYYGQAGSEASYIKAVSAKW